MNIPYHHSVYTPNADHTNVSQWPLQLRYLQRGIHRAYIALHIENNERLIGRLIGIKVIKVKSNDIKKADSQANCERSFYLTAC